MRYGGDVAFGAFGGFSPGANAFITGGSITGTNVPYVLAQSAIPFIGLSSGSVAANGAISGITALPRAYANAYCYFPANALATVSAAGWYYCTFSTTTAGVAFLNTYASGNPTIPSSPTAVTDGKGAFTGVTTEIFGPQITLPAGAMGPNGSWRLRRWESTTNSAGTKIMNTRWTGTGGTAVRTFTLSTTVTFQDDFYITNRGATNIQVSSNSAAGGVFTATAGAEVAVAVDSSVATTIVLGQTRNTATDNQVIGGYVIEVVYAA